MENNEQELMFKFQMFEQQIRAIQQQLQAVEQAIAEMGSLNLGMDELIGKKDNEILAPVGRGIYAKAKLISEELLVDIGENNSRNKRNNSKSDKKIKGNQGRIEQGIK